MKVALPKSKSVCLYLIFVLSIIFGAMKNPALKLLIDHNKILHIHHPKAITFCNVLFVGTLCSAIVVLFTMGAQKILSGLRNLNARSMLLLVIAAATQTTAVSWLFFVLEKTTVIQTVLLGQLEGVVYIFLAFLLLRTVLKLQELWGYALIFIAIFVLLFRSDLLTSEVTWLMIGAIFLDKITDIIEKKLLEQCSEAVILFAENILGAFFFFLIFTYFYGPMHFADAFTGELWILMLVYAGLTIVIADFLWLWATKKASPQMIGNSLLIDPAVSMFFAFLLLGEVPSHMQAIIFMIVMGGLIITRLKAPIRSKEQTRLRQICPAKI